MSLSEQSEKDLMKKDFNIVVLVDDLSRGRPEGSLFNSYYTEV